MKPLSKAHSKYFIICLLIVTSCGAADTGGPETPIHRYFEGYRKGDKALISEAFHDQKELSSIGLGVDVQYEIVSKLLVIEAPNSSPGDIQIMVERTTNWPNGPEHSIATFLTRKVRGEWKIIAFSAEQVKRSVD